MDEGEIIFHDRGPPTDLLKLDLREMEPIRRKIQYIFRDPHSSLNPRMTDQRHPGGAVRHPRHRHATRRARAAAVRLLEMVGLGAQHLEPLPHSFSGGHAAAHRHCPRACAAAATSSSATNPVSALDVSIQAQILNLLKDLQEEIGAHLTCSSRTNLAVINYIADRIAVMCAGRLVGLHRG